MRCIFSVVCNDIYVNNCAYLFQPIRKTKRRELNKYKQQGRHHRQQTPPPLSYYSLDEDSSNDEHGNMFKIII